MRLRIFVGFCVMLAFSAFAETEEQGGIVWSYTPKTGAFKGSFKIHALEDKVTSREKTKALKKYTVKVTGVVVNGIGYGKAVLKKPANEWTLSVD